MAGAASVLESAEHQRANARLRAAAPVLASLLDEVRSVPFTDLDAVYAGSSRSVVVPDTVEDATATYIVEDVPTGSTRWLVRRVTVRMHWVSAAGTMDMSGATLVSDRTVDASSGIFEVTATVTASSVPTTTDTGGTTTASNGLDPTATATDTTTTTTDTTTTATDTTTTTTEPPIAASTSPGIGVGSSNGKAKGKTK